MIKKAVIPAAGFGTRFLPATKAQPKEMLPIVDVPTIQVVVEEAVNSGIEDILIIIGRGKQAIVNHFDRTYERMHCSRSIAPAYSPALPGPGYSQYIGCRPEDIAHPSQTRKTVPATNAPASLYGN